MPSFTRDELQHAYDLYTATTDECSRTGDWRTFADIFTEDCHYIEHHFGEMHGRETVRAWTVAAMAPFPHMRFTRSWVTLDEENGAVLMEIRNVFDHPTKPGEEMWFPTWARLLYAGDGLFSSEEDVYNPERDGPRVVLEYLEAGGQMESDTVISPGDPIPPLA